GNQLEQRALSGPIGAEDGHQLARRDLERDVRARGARRIVPIAEGTVADRDRRVVAGGLCRRLAGGARRRGNPVGLRRLRPDAPRSPRGHTTRSVPMTRPRPPSLIRTVPSAPLTTPSIWQPLG